MFNIPTIYILLNGEICIHSFFNVDRRIYEHIFFFIDLRIKMLHVDNKSFKSTRILYKYDFFF